MNDFIGIKPSEKDLYYAERAIKKPVELDKRGKPSKVLRIEQY